jgi:hypothetical protein
MPLHVPNLDNRTYEGMLTEARKKILQTGSGWSDLGPSDPGTVLLEAFTYLTDQLIYRLNRLPEKAYLEFLRLMGLQRQPPAAAGVKLVFSVESPLEKPVEIPRGTRATLKRAGGAGEPPVFATVKAETLPAGARSVEVQAFHVELVSGELAGRGTGKPGLSVTAQRVPIVSPLGEGLDLVVGTEAVEGELKDRANALEFQGKAFRIWREVENFTDLGPDRFVYVADRLTGTITFAPALSSIEASEGDGKPMRRQGAMGEIPPQGREIRLWYPRGGGPEGNVAAATLDTLKDPIPPLKVTNPSAASGGRAAESLEDALVRGPQELHSLKRAVTASDFELVAMKNVGAIDRAKAFTKASLWKHAAPGTVEVLLVPYLPGADDGSVSVTEDKLRERETAEAKDRIQKSLDERRPLGTSCQVNWVRTKPVRAEARVVVHREEDPKAVEARLMKRLNQIINPLRTPIRKSGWPFGEPLRAFHIYETVRSEPGVSYVEDISFTVDRVPDQNVRSITQDQFQPHTWHAVAGDTNYRSMDDGAGWEVSGRFPGEEAMMVRGHPEEAGLLAVSTKLPGDKPGSAIYVSEDCGESWNELARTGFLIEDMAWTKRDGVPLLLLATEVGLYELILRSDRKPVPQQLLVDPQDPARGFYAVAVADLDIGEKVVIAAASGSGGVYLSSEGGRSQTYRLTGLTGEDIRVLAVEYAAGTVYFWAGAVAFGDDPGKGCFRLQVIDPRNTPEGWVPFGKDWTGGGVKSIALMGTTVFAATVSAGVLSLSSTDRDPGWKTPDFVRCGLPQKSQGKLLAVEDIAVDPAERFLFAVGGGGVFSSADRGASFENRSRHQFETVTLPATWLFSSLEHRITVVSEDDAQSR